MKTNNNFRILIVDDEMLNIELASVYLKEAGYKVSFATNAQGTIKGVESKKIDLILLDINMPDKNGFDICEILKKDSKTKDIPIIFLTAQKDIKYISRAFEVGGIDYINKPFNGVELKARVKTHLQNVAYLEEIKHKQSKLAQLSVTDSLTKLYNSLYFDSKITQYQNSGKKFWIIFIQLNNFEKINQFYGFHPANKIIRLFAKIIEKESLSNAIIARLYGTNFGIILNDYEQKTIEKNYNSISKSFLKNKELSKIVNFSTVLLHITGFTPIATIYKKVQHTTIKDKNNHKSYVLIES